jgi:hypothetical protein
MPFLNGSSFQMLIDDVAIGKSTSSAIMLNQELPDATTKDDLGWAKHIQGLRNGEIAVNSLSTYDGSVNFATFAELMILRTSVSFSFQSSSFEIIGTAKVQDVVEVSQAENVVSYDLTLKIDGAVTQINLAAQFLLLEDGFYLLLENGDKLILE